MLTDEDVERLVREYHEARRKPAMDSVYSGSSVVCELCSRGQHGLCVRPCTCREGHKRERHG